MTYTENVQQARDKIRHLTAEQRALDAQPNCREQVRRLVGACVDQADTLADVRSARTLEQLAAGQPADLLVVHGTAMTASGPAPVRVDLLPTAVRLLGAAAVRKALLVGIDAIPQGLPHDARTQRLAAIAAELDTLQSEEERLIREAAAIGEDIARRPDANAHYVLALGASQ